MGSSGTGQGKFGEDRDGSGDRQGSPRWVWGPSWRSKTGRKTLGEDRDGSEEPREEPGWVGVPTERCATGDNP